MTTYDELLTIAGPTDDELRSIEKSLDLYERTVSYWEEVVSDFEEFGLTDCIGYEQALEQYTMYSLMLEDSKRLLGIAA